MHKRNDSAAWGIAQTVNIFLTFTVELEWCVNFEMFSVAASCQTLIASQSAFMWVHYSLFLVLSCLSSMKKPQDSEAGVTDSSFVFW